ncbi:MAG TPA: hypothetical protein VJN44_06645, partial [Roseateles sp.]|nr:hypothetical protein [Roseateles sp.]
MNMPAAAPADQAAVPRPAAKKTRTATATASRQPAGKTKQARPAAAAKPSKAPKAATKAATKAVTQTVTKNVKAPVTKAAEPKPAKIKLVRDSFTMPADEYAALGALKQRALASAHPAKKSELLRAGVKLLAGLSD